MPDRDYQGVEATLPGNVVLGPESAHDSDRLLHPLAPGIFGDAKALELHVSVSLAHPENKLDSGVLQRLSISQADARSWLSISLIERIGYPPISAPFSWGSDKKLLIR